MGLAPGAIEWPRRLERDVDEVGERPVRVGVRRPVAIERVSRPDAVGAEQAGVADVFNGRACEVERDPRSDEHDDTDREKAVASAR